MTTFKPGDAVLVIGGPLAGNLTTIKSPPYVLDFDEVHIDDPCDVGLSYGDTVHELTLPLPYEYVWAKPSWMTKLLPDEPEASILRDELREERA